MLSIRFLQGCWLIGRDMQYGMSSRTGAGCQAGLGGLQVCKRKHANVIAESQTENRVAERARRELARRARSSKGPTCCLLLCAFRFDAEGLGTGFNPSMLKKLTQSVLQRLYQDVFNCTTPISSYTRACCQSTAAPYEPLAVPGSLGNPSGTQTQRLTQNWG